MADQPRKLNPIFRYGILAIVLALFIWNYVQEKKPLVQSGKLEYRMVTGTLDGQFQVILLETPDRYIILDSAYQNILTAEDGELVSRPKQLRILEKYKDIDYRVGFNESSTGLKPGYRVTREVFNELRFDEVMKYEVNKKVRDSLLGIIK